VMINQHLMLMKPIQRKKHNATNRFGRTAYCFKEQEKE
jgi:hypothetical protein